MLPTQRCSPTPGITGERQFNIHERNADARVRSPLLAAPVQESTSVKSPTVFWEPCPYIADSSFNARIQGLHILLIVKSKKAFCLNLSRNIYPPSFFDKFFQLWD